MSNWYQLEVEEPSLDVGGQIVVSSRTGQGGAAGFMQFLPPSNNPWPSVLATNSPTAAALEKNRAAKLKSTKKKKRADLIKEKEFVESLANSQKATIQDLSRELEGRSRELEQARQEIQEMRRKLKECLTKQKEEDKHWLWATGLRLGDNFANIQAASACRAAAQGDLPALNILLQHGTDIHQPNVDGRTALHLAATEGQKSTVKFLIKSGGEVNCKDRWKRTPLDDCVSQGHYGIATILDKAGTTQLKQTMSRLFAAGDFDPSMAKHQKIYEARKQLRSKQIAKMNKKSSKSITSRPSKGSDELQEQQPQDIEPSELQHFFSKRVPPSEPPPPVPQPAHFLSGPPFVHHPASGMHASNVRQVSSLGDSPPARDRSKPPHLREIRKNSPSPPIFPHNVTGIAPSPPVGKTVQPKGVATRSTAPASTTSQTREVFEPEELKQSHPMRDKKKPSRAIQRTRDSNGHSEVDSGRGSMGTGTELGSGPVPIHGNHEVGNGKNGRSSKKVIKASSSAKSSKREKPIDKIRDSSGTRTSAGSLGASAGSGVGKGTGIPHVGMGLGPKFSTPSLTGNDEMVGLGGGLQGGTVFGVIRGICNVPDCPCKGYKAALGASACICSHFPACHQKIGMQEDYLPPLTREEVPVLIKKDPNQRTEWPQQLNPFLPPYEDDLAQVQTWLRSFPVVVPAKMVDFISLVGEGANAHVYKGTYKGQTVAVKALKNKTAPTEIDKQKNDLCKEVEIMALVECPQVVKLLGIIVEPRICLLIEFCPKGSMHDIIKESSFKLSWSLLFRWYWQTLLGIEYLHGLNVLHRDIKTLNLLITGEDTVKVADFGASRFSGEHGKHLTTLGKLRGTYCYTAPEIYFSKQYTTASDLYSLGVVLWEMVTKCIKKYTAPFAEFTEIIYDFQIIIQAAKFDARPTIPTNCPHMLEKLIKRLWAGEPTSRPTLATLKDCIGTLQINYDSQPALWDKCIGGSHKEAQAVSQCFTTSSSSGHPLPALTASAAPATTTKKKKKKHFG